MKELEAAVTGKEADVEALEGKGAGEEVDVEDLLAEEDTATRGWSRNRRGIVVEAGRRVKEPTLGARTYKRPSGEPDRWRSRR